MTTSFGPRDPHQIFEHERRIGEQRTARIGDDLDLREHFRVDPVHQAGKIVRLFRRQHVAVHDVERVAGLPHVQAGKRAPGAADGVEGAAATGFQRTGAVERLPDDLLRLLDRLGGYVLQREPAERKRHAALDALALDLGQFERAAAEIADDAVGLVETGHHAERGQLRFPLAGQHVDLGAADALGLGDEGLAVVRIAASRRCDRPELRDLHPIAERPKASQSRQRLVDGIGGQQPGRLHLATEPAQHLFVEDRRRAAGQPLVDDEAH